MKLNTKKALVSILAVSISQLAGANTFNSIASGVWSNPASWDDGALFPDTYAADIAIINAGHSIDYTGGMTTPAGLVGAGGFAIAAGNTLTIDGGTLTQTTFTQEMRVGEGTGGGTGMLTIQTGGTLDTGASIGLFVGTKISGATAGSGQLDIIAGLLKLGAGASANGLGIGVNSSTGVLNVGNGAGIADSTLDLATNNIQMGVGLTGGTGSVTIKSDGVVNFGTANITVGQGGGNGTVTLLGSGALTGGSGAIVVGDGAGSVGHLTNAGAISSTGEIRIGGNGGGGTFNMTAGTAATTGEFNIGVDAGSVGVATISGGMVGTGQISVGRNGGTGTLTTSGTITTSGNNSSVIIGNGGTGDLFISGGTLTVGAANNSHIEIGNGAGSLGHVHQTGGTVSYSSWTSMGVNSNTATAIWDISAGNITSGAGFEVGSDGVGTMNISGTANIATAGYSLGLRNGSLGTVNMTGGTIASTGQVVVGGGQTAGTGVFNVSAGTVSSVNETRVGEGTGATGTLNISGTTAWTSGGELQVGNDGGTGTVNMSGGTVQINQWGAIGRNGGTGILNFSGGTIQMGGGNRTFDIGVFGGNGNPFGTGTMNQTGGTLINTTNTTNIGRDGSGVGIWNISAGSASLHDLVVGNGGAGTLNVSGTGSISTANGWMFVGNGGTAVGVVNQTGGTIDNSAGWMLIGRADGASATYNQSGGVSSTGRLMIATDNGSSKSGTLNVSGGTFNNGGWTEIGGSNAGNTGTLNISGSGVVNFTGGQDAQVGYNNGTGFLNVTGGGTLNQNWWLNIGRQGASNGTAVVDGAGSKIVLTNRGDGNGDVRLNIGGDPNGGDTGTGSLTISHGGAVNKNSGGGEWNVGDHATSVGTVTVNTGGTLTNQNGDSFIGRDGGTGTVNISGVGSIVSTSAAGGGSQVHVGVGGGSTGAVNITSGGAFTTNQGWFGIGQDSSTGVVTVDGAGSSLTSHGLIVGWSGTGNGTLNIQNGAVVTNNTPNGSVQEVSIGRDNATATGTINILSGGTLNAGRAFRIGANGFGTVNINAGTFVGSAGDWAYIGDGSSSNGLVNVVNGTFTHNDSLMIANNNGAHGTFNQSGTSTTLITNEITVGRAGGIGVVTINGGSFQVNNTAFFGRDGGSNGTFNMSGATSSFVGGASVRFGESGTSVANITGGAGSSAAETIIGNNLGGSGVFNLSGAGTTWTANGEFQVGNHLGTGVVNMTGGSITANSWVAIGRDGGTGTVNLSGGTITKGNTGPNNPGTFDIGTFGNGATPASGTLNQTGGAVVNTVTDTNIARDNSGSGSWNLSAGTAVLARLNVGNGGSGTLNMTGGSLSTSDRLSIGVNGGSTGVANLNGGVVTTPFIEAGGGTATLSFAGGTAKASQDQTDFMRGFTNSGGHSAITLAGPAGGKIDTNGFTVTIAAGNEITGTKLTKIGNGILNIQSLQTYSTLETDAGTTNVYTPVGTGTSTITANAATNLYVSQTLSALNIGNGAVVTFGNGLPFAPEPVKFSGAAVGIVPEPSSIGLLIVGAFGLIARRRRSN